MQPDTIIASGSFLDASEIIIISLLSLYIKLIYGHHVILICHQQIYL